MQGHIHVWCASCGARVTPKGPVRFDTADDMAAVGLKVQSVLLRHQKSCRFHKIVGMLQDPTVVIET